MTHETHDAPHHARVVARPSLEASPAATIAAPDVVPENAVTTLLLRQCAGAPFAERLLAELIADEEPVRRRLQDIKGQVVMSLASSLDDPRKALAVAKVLREVVRLGATISQRQQETVTALASIRAQRQLLESQQGGFNGD